MKICINDIFLRDSGNGRDPIVTIGARSILKKYNVTNIYRGVVLDNRLSFNKHTHEMLYIKKQLDHYINAE